MRKTVRTQARMLAVALMAFVVVVSACGGSSSQVIETVSAQSAAEQLSADPGTVLLDIRTPEEVAAGQIAGAINIDFYAADFEAQIGELDRDTRYVIYCRSGNRTSQALGMFDRLGFADVVDVDGGIVAWFEAGLPVR